MPALDDLLGHLRRIHLAFVLAAVAIFMALASSDEVYEVALRQLTHTVRLADALSAETVAMSVVRSVDPDAEGVPVDGTRTLEAFLEEALVDFLEVLEVYPDETEFGFFSLNLEAGEPGYVGTIDDLREYERQWSWFEHRLALLADGATAYASPRRLFEVRPRTLADHRAFLNRLLTVDRLYVRPTFHGPYFGRGTLVSERYRPPDDLLDELRAMGRLRLYLTLNNLQFADDRSVSVYQQSQGHIVEDPAGYEDYDFEFDTFALDVQARPLEGDGQTLTFGLSLPVMFTRLQPVFVAEALEDLGADATAYARYVSGARSFDRLFPELMDVSARLTSLSPDELELFLREQAQRGGAPISVLGLQIDRELIEVWGVLVMLVIQLYFCMHYRTLLDRWPPDGEVAFPWIGLYRYRLAALVFRASMTLPIVVTVYAAFKAGVDAFGVLTIALAAALASWTESISRRVARLPRADSAVA